MKSYYKYADDVINGNIVAGETIKLACLRFKADLQREDLVFRDDKVERAINFIGTLRHFTGKHSGSRFILEGWQ